MTVGEEDDFRERQGDWVLDWERLAGGRRALRDQVRFDREWGRLRRYAADSGVRLIGDLPIYVAPGSVDHRSHPEFFRDDAVAGAPPDDFAPKGQHWGNPLYDWPALQGRGYAMVDAAAAAELRAVRPRADRPLPGVRRLLVDPGRRARRDLRSAGAAVRGRRRSGRSSGSSGRSR